jgi:hypothetical protein
VQVDALVFEKLPSAHSVHDDELLAPSTLLARPAAHAVQVVAPAALQ